MISWLECGAPSKVCHIFKEGGASRSPFFMRERAMEEDQERVIFSKIGELIEEIGEVDVLDLLSAMMRVAAVVVAHAPDENQREIVAAHMIGGFHLYLADVLEQDGKTMTAREKRAYEQAQAMMEAPVGGVQ